jgi:hypothetical protein
VTKDGDQVTLAAGFDAQHAEPVLVVMEGDALDEPGQGLDRRARLQCMVHRAMMEFRILGCHRDRLGRAFPAALAPGGEGA